MRRARSAVPIVLLAVILIAIACNAEGIFTGVSFGAMWWPSFDEDLVTYNLYRLLDVGCNSIILIVDWYVDTYTDPSIEPWYRDRPGFPDTNWFYPTLYDHEVRYVIETAHSLGLTVMLKLHVETLDWMKTGIGRFGLHPRGERWDDLFDSYLAYADHYAEMCEELGVEILCLGCEMESMTQAAIDGLPDPDRRWRELIAEVRETYSGELTYSCAVMGSWTRPFSSPGKVTFWDALDYIGVELYRGLSNTLEPTLEQLEEGVRDTFVRFVEPLVRQYDRPVLLPELNFMHCDGTNMSPYSPDNPPRTTCDYQEHADCYEAVLSVVEEISQTNEYLKGIYWWSGMLVYPWEDLTPDFGEPCAGTDLWGTLAESVVRAHWQGTNGWTIPTASAADLSFDILPQEAATDGCQVKVRVNEELGKGIVEVTPAEGWEFERWDGNADLESFPITSFPLGHTDLPRAIFRVSPCRPCSADVAIGNSVGAEGSFWFTGGDSVCKGIDPIASAGQLVVRYNYPSDGNDKVALRFDPPFDASTYTGVQFTARANPDVMVSIEVASQDRGLHLLENDDDWKSSSTTCAVRLSTEARTFRFPFASFHDPDWLLAQYPDVTPGVNPYAIWEIQFLPEGQPARIEILDVSFYLEP